jgi:preprotein translocase subunit SecG
VTAIRITLQVLLVITSLFLTILILLHKGRGGGLSDMFGGGASSSMGSSGVAERNLNRFTIAVGLLWAAAVVLLGILERVNSSTI